MDVSFFKKPVLATVALVSAVGILSVGHAAYSYANLKPGTPFSVKAWNAVVGNLADHESRIVALSSKVSSLASAGGKASAMPTQAIAAQTATSTGSAYRTACAYNSATRYPTCCRVAVTTGAVTCKYSYNLSYAWDKFQNDPFPAATTAGDYSVSLFNNEDNVFIACRSNGMNGTAECASSTDMRYPWNKLQHNPF